MTAPKVPKVRIIPEQRWGPYPGTQYWVRCDACGDVTVPQATKRAAKRYRAAYRATHRTAGGSR